MNCGHVLRGLMCFQLAEGEVFSFAPAVSGITTWGHNNDCREEIIVWPIYLSEYGVSLNRPSRHNIWRHLSVVSLAAYRLD
jgi:hypothetical protein